ncbi:L,D-transpeptidase [uncultured Martelella sp.]|uniref:L,D-transpeptidase n=1 Tax=uncultured Martelella sp. TaxID=392331 RepID=UPI0029C8A279|nr:L,D-transpeptidase [uncultured Martelella sp.]
MQESDTQAPLTRRTFVLGALPLAMSVSACVSTQPAVKTQPVEETPEARISTPRSPERDLQYAAVTDDGHEIPAVPYWQMNPQMLRQRVENPTGEPPGTVVVDTPSRFLYLVEDDGSAMRYGVGIGRTGFSWEGEGVIHWRQHWPRWKPPRDMIARDPALEIYSVANGGMAPGIMNPLGARALYIFQNGKDTLYRLHGSPEWSSIGNAVSSGCVRLLNQDVIDLYDRVPYHARIVVRQQPVGV